MKFVSQQSLKFEWNLYIGKPPQKLWSEDNYTLWAKKQEK